jgi:hypothetical protein
MLEDCFADFIEAANFFFHLREFTEFMSKPHGAGQIVEAFALAI